ncbi:MAG: hypothetical protein ACLFV2_08480 [Desulfurivibrionaceae bacterium]
MSIDRKKLNDLAGYRNEKNPVVSLYLNVTTLRNYRSELNSLIHTTLPSLEERYDKQQLKGLRQIFDKLEEYARTSLDKLENTRLIVIFTDNDGFWEEFYLPVGLPSQMVVEPDPYIRPLSMLLDEFPSYCVLVCDSNKARLFSLYMGGFEEDSEIFLKEEVPGQIRVHRSLTRSSTSVQGGLGDEGIRRHIQDHIQRHMKNVADMTLDYYKDRGFNRLILGGLDEKGRSLLRNHLHSYLKQCLIGEFKAGTSDRTGDIREKALKVAQDYERRHEMDLIDSLFEEKGRNLGVFGVEPVIEALMMGQVHTLIMENDFKKSGFICAGDHILSTYLEICPVCGQEMDRTEDLAEEMVAEALYQNSEVEHVFAEHRDFHEYQVGAILRFRV